MNLSTKYWKHHKGRGAALLAAIMISTMSMTFGVFLARSASQTRVEDRLDFAGDYDIVLPLTDETELSRLPEYWEISQYRTILNGGTCKTKYSAAIRFGAMDHENTWELFHYKPEKQGRYPEAVGEICGYRSSFEALGVAPMVGNRFEMELYDLNGNFLEIKSFTIVGVLNDWKDVYGQGIRTMDSHLIWTGLTTDDIDFPQMFLYKEDLPADFSLTALVLCDPDCVSWQVVNRLREDGIMAYNNGRTAELQAIAAFGDAETTQNALYENAHLSYYDFYSSTLIPVFLGIVLFVSFVSVYGVMSGAMADRQRQMGLFRSMGMSKRSVVKRLLGEALFFDVTGVVLGYALGILIYVVYLKAVNTFGSVRIYSAFGAHPVAKGISLNPYLYPWLLAICSSALAVSIPLVKGIRRSPNEMLFPEKESKRGKKKKSAKDYGIIKKVVLKNLNRDKGVVFLMLLTGWSFVFGAAFMLGKSDQDNFSAYESLGEIGGTNADYYVSKNFQNLQIGNLQYNRHAEGISPEDLAALKASEDTDTLSAVMKLPGVKLLYQKSTVPKSIEEALDQLETYHNIQDFMGDFEYKARLIQGYSEEDLLYGLPCTAIEDDFFKSLEPYVISGELDREGLKDGSKIVIAQYPGQEISEKGMINPYQVGDEVALTDVVVSDPVVENFDFSHGEVPPGYEPTLYYDDTDGLRTNVPGYTFGEKVVSHAQICAILSIDNEYLTNVLYAGSFVDNERHAGKLSPGYNILCSVDAVEKWGLPDSRYTDVYVNLKRRANLERFETLWYAIVGKSGDVTSISQNAIRRSILMKDFSNLAVFASMITLVILTGCFGMINSYQFAVNKNLQNFQILRAVGMSRKRLVKTYISEMFLWPFIAVVTAVIPIEIFDLVRRYAYHYAFDLQHNSYILTESGKMTACWQVRFPWYIHLWEQPIVPIMVIAFALTILVNITAGILPMMKIQKMSIVEGIRNDDF